MPPDTTTVNPAKAETTKERRDERQSMWLDEQKINETS